MDGTVRGPASFATQADALFRKNVTFQKRNWRTNTCIIAFPLLLCLIIVIIQNLVNNQLDKADNRCGCTCVDAKGDGACEEECGIQYSTPDQAIFCLIQSPPRWPPLLQVPRPEFRAARDDFIPYPDLPDESCRRTGSCPTTALFTGTDRSLAERLAANLFMSTSSLNSSDFLGTLSGFILGTDTVPNSEQFIEPAFASDRPIYVVQPQCTANFTLSVPIEIATVTIQQEVKCIQGLSLWRDSLSVVNDELFKGYQQGNAEKKPNEIVAAYDFLNSNEKIFNVRIWYNSTYNSDIGTSFSILRIPRSMNMASNAYLQFLKGTGVKMQFEFVKEMPKPATELRLDLSSLIGTLFFIWIIELPFPVILTYLVYEKQQKLKIMMKMHGLGDGPYGMISYAYFLCLSLVYMLCFVIFGSVIGLNFFRLNDYGIQFVFYFIYINLQIALAFYVATNFSSVKTATVIGYIYVFGSGLLGEFLFRFFIEDTSFSRSWVLIMEIIPAFSLYRGMYELSQYSFLGNYMGTSGMRWNDLNDSKNGMKDVLIIMIVEWLLLLPIVCYLDQKPVLEQQGSVSLDIDKADVSQERKLVEQLLLEPSANYAIICDNLRKVYPGRDGNPEKVAVQRLSLALPHGECFGMLGPNGAGKSSLINMMIGLITPTSGTTFVQGMDIRVNMNKIYTGIGVCPQHDLLWETLTGKEHLMFYGRLKNLKGAALAQAVEESLKSVNLFHGGVGDKQAGKYSGGMKRRLSIAISLIGDPKVVYMDEPSTGLDPASRGNLWNVVKRAKQDRAIILTTHSMEEAEVLCDRLGIFVDGSLQCIGNPKELKARYGGSFVLTITTSSSEEEEVESLVRRLSPSAKKIYHISGTQKFELPKNEVRLADVFQAIENAKSDFTIHAWGLADTTLEDVFIKVAKGAESFNVL